MRGTLLTLLTAALLFSFGTAMAQDGAITLDHVDGLTAGGRLPTDNQIRFVLHINNNTGASVDGISNAFRVYSPNGACWTTIVGDTLSSVGFGNYFDLTFFILNFGVNGRGADTVAFAGSRLFAGGLPAGFNDTATALQSAL